MEHDPCDSRDPYDLAALAALAALSGLTALLDRPSSARLRTPRPRPAGRLRALPPSAPETLRLVRERLASAGGLFESVSLDELMIPFAEQGGQGGQEEFRARCLHVPNCYLLRDHGLLIEDLYRDPRSGHTRSRFRPAPDADARLAARQQGCRRKEMPHAS